MKNVAINVALLLIRGIKKILRADDMKDIEDSACNPPHVNMGQIFLLYENRDKN